LKDDRLFAFAELWESCSIVTTDGISLAFPMAGATVRRNLLKQGDVRRRSGNRAEDVSIGGGKSEGVCTSV
jgi:hypothetical protein